MILDYFVIRGLQDIRPCAEIYSFAIDFYNDITGLNVNAEKAWNLQSKGNVAKGSTEVGRELVTLFKNHLSDLTFNYLILFMAGVPDTFRIDSSINMFDCVREMERYYRKEEF